MDTTYGEFQGTDLDPSADWDFDDDFEEEGNDLLPILGASALLAALVGGVLVVVGRRHNPNPTPEERIQEVVSQIEKGGKKSVKAVQHAVDDGKLADMLDDALAYTRHRARDASDTLQDSKLTDALEEAMVKARKAASRVDVQDTTDQVSKGVRKSIKKARHQARDLAIAAAVESAFARARKGASNLDVAEIAQDVRKRAGDAADDIDAGGALDSLRGRVTSAFEAVRDDVAPKAVDAAQDAVEKVREDVIPAAQERVSKIVEQTEIDKKAAQAAKSARHGMESLNDVLKGLFAVVLAKIVDEFLPEARKMGNRAVETAREDVIPAVADRAGDAAQKLREDVLPKVGEAAQNTPDMLGDLLKSARDMADDLMEKAQPVAADAATFSRHKASDFAQFSRHRAGDIADAARDGKGGITGAVSSAGQGVKGAVSTAGQGVKGAAVATTNASKETGAILLWLSVLAGIIFMIFVNDKEKQKEIVNNIRQFFGELREMWRDLQGEDYELQPPGAGTTDTNI